MHRPSALSDNASKLGTAHYHPRITALWSALAPTSSMVGTPYRKPAAKTPPTTATATAGIQASHLLAALLGALAVQSLLVLQFLGLSPWIVWPVALAAGGLITMMAATAKARKTTDVVPVSAATLLVCLGLALTLLILGGEGRLLYATEDWMARDAVLADMGRNTWPVTYDTAKGLHILRAPIGMYLLPALIGGTSQVGRDIALLICNSAILTVLFALGATLFSSNRDRLIAAVTFVMFSGWDAIGTIVRLISFGQANVDHLERWAGSMQYTAHITQLFWVPQHAMAGWIVAAAFVHWRRGSVPLGVFAASVPLVALWSPFALIGAIPFAAFAGVVALRDRALSIRDVMLAAAALAISLPALFYLRAGAESVGGGLLGQPPLAYMLFVLFELLPIVGPIVLFAAYAGLGRPVIYLAIALLFLMPFGQIGAGIDFQMRASIMAQAIVAIAFADLTVRLFAKGFNIREPAVAGLAGIMILSSITGLFEIARAIRLNPSPAPQCTLIEVWHRQTNTGALAGPNNFVSPIATYIASVEALPHAMKPLNPTVVPERKNPVCWPGTWRSTR